MTDREQLLHLVDRARRGVALPAELDQLAAGITAVAQRFNLLEQGAIERSALLEEARDTLEAAGINEAHGGDSWPRLVPAIEELVKRAEKAEAAIERVRDLCDRYQTWHDGGWAPSDAATVAREYRAALDERQPTT